VGRKPLEPDAISDFRDRICDAAINLIAEDGFEGLSLRRLAAELGCSHTTPYRYFDSKEDIFLAVRARCLDRFTTHQQAAVARARSPEDRLRALARGYVSYARQHPAAFRISFQLDQPPAPAHGALQDASRRAWTVLRDTVADAVGSGAIAGDVEALAHIFWAAMHGIASLHLAGKLRVPVGGLVTPTIDALLSAHRPDQGSR